MENDPQRRLDMANPSLRNGGLIPGFKGYAVNMIELAVRDLDIGTNSHGLRETLFYGLFGDLQVYETGKDLEAALPYIKDGVDAVSLDGVISNRDGFLFSGCWYVQLSSSVIFHPSLVIYDC